MSNFGRGRNAKTIYDEDLDIILKFGGGLNTRSSEDDIAERESAKGGQNYDLDPGNLEFRPRRPYTLVATAPNEARINGFINLIQSDGTVKLLVQAGGNIYEYFGAQSGIDTTPMGTVSTSARLRGRIEHNWTLTDSVIVTDMALVEDVMVYDGSTLTDIVFSPSGTDLRAKYCTIDNDRAFFANIYNNSTYLPHVLIGSELEDYTTISVSDRPSTSIGAADPFFLTSPDLRPINGFVSEFNKITISTENGRIYVVEGTDATSFFVSDFYPRSYASGNESVVNIGNILLYGRAGRIELLRDTDRFADSEANDLSLSIGDDTFQTYKDWKIAYNGRTQRAYCFPDSVSACYVFHLPMIATGLSPWVKYTTKSDFAFQPTVVMNVIDPDDGLEYIFMGDESGNIFRMEGARGQGDEGTHDITSTHVTRLVGYGKNVQTSDYQGYIKYRKKNDYDASITFQFAGQTAYDETVTVSVPAADANYYNDQNYFSGGIYFGRQFSNRLIRQQISIPGSGEDFQVKVEVETKKDFQINEVGFRYEGSEI